MDPIVVQKYGGSSVADVDKLRGVARRAVAARERGYSVVVVVSAMGKTTDQLLSQAKQVAANPSSRELDMLLSVGERISMALLSLAIQELGCEAVSLTGSQSGIITSDSHSNARIVDVRPVRVLDELERGRIVIVAGFQGMSYRREITTLGRGGSDTTAVALAAALGARWCEICSDVDGVYTADPRLVSAARHIPELSYNEMEALGEAGAKVLNPDAVEFARAKGVRVRLTGAFADGQGTLLLESVPLAAGRNVRAVAHAERLIRARVPAADWTMHERLLGWLAVEGLPAPFWMVDGEAGRVVLHLDPKDLHGWDKQRERLERAFPGTTTHDDEGAVSLIGPRIGQDAGLMAQLLGVAATAGAARRWAKAFRDSLTVGVERATVARVVEAAHRRFVEGE